ncbi:MAG: Rrf2 family transcriptional regulator [Rickettsiales bacterium]|jgi:Rrf2 family protein|nr:Rrf2 family transcriptional regulator [Rickettsiales bacterium]
MSVLPKKFFLVLEASLYIAQHAGVRAVSGKEICAHIGLSARHLEPLLQALVHHGILRGIRGPKGGYLLLKERRKVTLKDLFLIAEGLEVDTAFKELLEYSPYSGIMNPLYKKAEAVLMAHLEKETLDDLCARAQSLPAKPGKVTRRGEGSDFMI